METSFFDSVPFGIMGLAIVGSSWCLSGLVMGNAPKRNIPYSAVQRLGGIMSLVLGIAIMVVTGMYPHGSTGAMTLTILLYFFTGVISNIMCDIMSIAMQQGPNGIIWGITQSGTVGSFLTGILFFGVKATPVRILGITLLLAAVICFGMSKEKKEPVKTAAYKPLMFRGHVLDWKILSLICFILVAVQQSITTIPSYYESCRQITPIFRSIVLTSGGLVGTVSWAWLRKLPNPLAIPRAILWKKWLWVYVLVMQFFGLLFAYTLFYPGMDILAKAGLGGMSYPTMVGSCIIAFTLSSVFILREKAKPLQIFAVLVCIFGLCCLCQQA